MEQNTGNEMDTGLMQVNLHRKVRRGGFERGDTREPQGSSRED